MTTVTDLKTLLTIDAFEDATGLLLRDCSQQCHGASLALVRSGLLPPEARVARGTCKGVGGQHSWVTVGDPYASDVVIVDPTLWSYVPQIKGIWVGSAKAGKHRPHGAGSIWDWGRPPQAEAASIDLTPATPLSNPAAQFLEILGPLDRRGWQILASAPVLGWPSGEILAAMADTEALRAVVPIDPLGMLTDRNPGNLFR